jgi:hypothetical protein
MCFLHIISRALLSTYDGVRNDPTVTIWKNCTHILRQVNNNESKLSSVSVIGQSRRCKTGVNHLYGTRLNTCRAGTAIPFRAPGMSNSASCTFLSNRVRQGLNNMEEAMPVGQNSLVNDDTEFRAHFVEQRRFMPVDLILISRTQRHRAARRKDTCMRV